MGAAIGLRADYDGEALRRLAKASRDAKQTRRLLALAAIYDGGSRSEAAKLGGVGLQIVRDWVVRFNAEGPDGLVDRKARGGMPKLTPEQRQALSAIVERGPIPAVDGVVRWRLIDLAQWVWEEFGVSLSESGMSRMLNRLLKKPTSKGAGLRAMGVGRRDCRRFVKRLAGCRLILLTRRPPGRAVWASG